MGWSSGSYLAEELWDKLKDMIPTALHRRAARLIVKAFDEHDADDWSGVKNGLWWLSLTPQERQMATDEHEG